MRLTENQVRRAFVDTEIGNDGRFYERVAEELNAQTESVCLLCGVPSHECIDPLHHLAEAHQQVRYP